MAVQQPVASGTWLGVPRARVESDVRAASAAVAAGTLLGFVVIGWGSRLAMMLLAKLNPEVTGRISDDGFRMGQFTLGDTMGLVLFSTILGAVGGLLYLAIRPLRMGPSWFQHAALFVGPSVVVGSMLVHTDGIDFRVLHPAWFAIALFVALPGVYALSVALLAERWLADDAWFRRRPLSHVAPVLVALIPFWPLVIAVLIAWALRNLYLATADASASAKLAWVARGGLAVVFALALLNLVGEILELT
ncbi:MAG: hypothetical protein KY469_01785 [Actinobacteria bacterium]|nr:hypothetical protein [Actinomycetota bacterium]